MEEIPIHRHTCRLIVIDNRFLIISDKDACNDTNAIPTRSRYAGTYAAVITGWYGWEGLGGQGMGCKWLAGLVWEGLGGQGMGCEWLAGFVCTWTVRMGGAGRSGAGL